MAGARAPGGRHLRGSTGSGQTAGGNCFLAPPGGWGEEKILALISDPMGDADSQPKLKTHGVPCCWERRGVAGESYGSGELLVPKASPCRGGLDGMRTGD